MRLDKYLSDCNIGTRSEIKDYIRKGFVKVDGNIIKKPETAVDENKSVIEFKNSKLSYKRFIYIILNKPSGIITASMDKKARTVLDLISPLPAKNLVPVGRLDKDTTGLLLITNDGELNHRLLSPKYHVDKTYVVKTSKPLSAPDLKLLSEGVDIGDEDKTLPAKAIINNDGFLELTIHEGRFHQVKRMLEAVDNEVIMLHRKSFGPLNLNNGPDEGKWRELTEDEIRQIDFR